MILLHSHQYELIHIEKANSAAFPSTVLLAFTVCQFNKYFSNHVAAWNLSLQPDINEILVQHSQFSQRVSIACYAKRCISYHKSVRLSVRQSLALCQND